jgi:MFS family permease
LCLPLVAWLNPRKNPDFAWAFASRFMFVLAYAFLATYQAYYLLEKIGSAKAEVPQQIFLGTLTQSAVVVAASLIGGKLSDRTGRRKSSCSPRRSCTAWRCS